MQPANLHNNLLTPSRKGVPLSTARLINALHPNLHTFSPDVYFNQELTYKYLNNV